MANKNSKKKSKKGPSTGVKSREISSGQHELVPGLSVSSSGPNGRDRESSSGTSHSSAFNFQHTENKLNSFHSSMVEYLNSLYTLSGGSTLIDTSNDEKSASTNNIHNLKEIPSIPIPIDMISDETIIEHGRAASDTEWNDSNSFRRYDLLAGRETDLKSILSKQPSRRPRIYHYLLEKFNSWVEENVYQFDEPVDDKKESDKNFYHPDSQSKKEMIEENRRNCFEVFSSLSEKGLAEEMRNERQDRETVEELLDEMSKTPLFSSLIREIRDPKSTNQVDPQKMISFTRLLCTKFASQQDQLKEMEWNLHLYEKRDKSHRDHISELVAENGKLTSQMIILQQICRYQSSDITTLRSQATASTNMENGSFSQNSQKPVNGASNCNGGSHVEDKTDRINDLNIASTHHEPNATNGIFLASHDEDTQKALDSLLTEQDISKVRPAFMKVVKSLCDQHKNLAKYTFEVVRNKDLEAAVYRHRCEKSKQETNTFKNRATSLQEELDSRQKSEQNFRRIFGVVTAHLESCSKLCSEMCDGRKLDIPTTVINSEDTPEDILEKIGLLQNVHNLALHDCQERCVGHARLRAKLTSLCKELIGERSKLTNQLAEHKRFMSQVVGDVLEHSRNMYTTCVKAANDDRFGIQGGGDEITDLASFKLEEVLKKLADSSTADKSVVNGNPNYDASLRSLIDAFINFDKDSGFEENFDDDGNLKCDSFALGTAMELVFLMISITTRTVVDNTGMEVDTQESQALEASYTNLVASDANLMNFAEKYFGSAVEMPSKLTQKSFSDIAQILILNMGLYLKLVDLDDSPEARLFIGQVFTFRDKFMDKFQDLLASY